MRVLGRRRAARDAREAVEHLDVAGRAVAVLVAGERRVRVTRRAGRLVRVEVRLRASAAALCPAVVAAALLVDVVVHLQLVELAPVWPRGKVLDALGSVSCTPDTTHRLVGLGLDVDLDRGQRAAVEREDLALVSASALLCMLKLQPTVADSIVCGVNRMRVLSEYMRPMQ